MLHEAVVLLLASASSVSACAFDNDTGVLAQSGAPTPQFEVVSESWFTNQEAVGFAGASYVKFEQPLQMTPFELEAADLLGNVPVFIEPGDYDAEVIYFMVSSADCVFQRYLRQ